MKNGKVKVCTVCSKPMRKKGQLCQSCAQISHKAAKIVGSKYKTMTQY